MDSVILARDIVAELLRLEREQAATAPGQGVSPLGGTKFLTSEGLNALPVQGQQTQFVLQKTFAEPRAWIVSMSGVIAQGSAAGGPAFPYAKFRVLWGSSGAGFETEVDGFSDQFLAVWGNQVTVIAEWDFDQFARFGAVGRPAFPTRMQLSASISPSDGGIPKAFRSFYMSTDVAAKVVTVPVPYAATGVIVRQPRTAWTNTSLFFTDVNGGGVGVDVYSVAAVQAAHDRGEYLAVPSLSDSVNVNIVADGAAPQPLLLEFLVQP